MNGQSDTYTKPKNASQNTKNTFMHQRTKILYMWKTKNTEWNIKWNIIDVWARKKKKDVLTYTVVEQTYAKREDANKNCQPINSSRASNIILEVKTKKKHDISVIHKHYRIRPKLLKKNQTNATILKTRTKIYGRAEKI